MSTFRRQASSVPHFHQHHRRTGLYLDIDLDFIIAQSIKKVLNKLDDLSIIPTAVNLNIQLAR